MEYVLQTRHIYRKLDDRRSSISHQLVVQSAEPVARVRFQVVKRYHVDTEGKPIPDSSSELYLAKRKKVSEKSKAKSIEEIYQFEFCTKCNEVKPPRAHHCSVCDTCVLKMDHHCPFVGNCIGLSNRKPFFLHCFYATLTLVQLWLTTYLYCRDTQNDKYDSKISFLIAYSGAWSFALTGITGLHTFLIMKNWTTLEMAALMKERDIFKD